MSCMGVWEYGTGYGLMGAAVVGLRVLCVICLYGYGLACGAGAVIGRNGPWHAVGRITGLRDI